MDGAQFDQFAQRLVWIPRSRRAALQAGGLGLSAALLRRRGFAARGDVGSGELARAGGTPVAESTPGACPAGTANEVFMDGAWLCRQRYALCTTAACQPSAHDPTVANCRCFVEEGYSIGFTTCRQRTPVGKMVVSTFSTQNVTSRMNAMFCPASDRWANCLDVPCQIDPRDPTAALCPCPIVERGPSLTFGGECDVESCSSVIWSAATPPGVVQYAAAMRCVDQPVRFPAICPSATPVASPRERPRADEVGTRPRPPAAASEHSSVAHAAKSPRVTGVDIRAKSGNVYVRSTEVRGDGAGSDSRAAHAIDRTARNEPIALRDSSRRAIDSGGRHLVHRRGNAA